MPVLQYLAVRTGVLARKYWKFARPNAYVCPAPRGLTLCEDETLCSCHRQPIYELL